ncbi:MAG: FHA domain-containing protein [Algisphaera sp.]
MLIVIVAAGPDKGRIFEFDGKQPVVLGREDGEENVELQLNDPSVSRRHARLWCEAGRWYSQDLDSRSGTKRNDHTLDSQKHALRDGDRLQLGNTVLVISRKQSSSTRADNATAPPSQPPTRKRLRTLAWISGGAAAALLIGLNVASLLTQQQAAQQLDRGLSHHLAQTQDTVNQGVSELRGLVAVTPEIKSAIDRFAGHTDAKLDATLDALARAEQEDVVLTNALASLHNQLEGLSGLEQATALAAEITTLRTTLAQKHTSFATLTTQLDAIALHIDHLDQTARHTPGANPNSSNIPNDPNINLSLNTIMAALEELRRDAAADPLRPQLETLLARLSTRQPTPPHVDASLSTPSNPALNQVLAQLQSLHQDNRHLDAQLDALRSAPFENRAMLDEALAQLGKQDQATQQAVAKRLDLAMAELRGKSITDADQLRRLINREVVSAVDHAKTTTARRSGSSRPARLTRTEAAYQLAFESGQKVTIGTLSTDPESGETTGGRILDPALAQARGFENWRDWYLMDDLAARKQTRNAAAAVARNDRTRGNGVLQLPATATPSTPVTSTVEFSASPAE